ncbi:MAG: serine/threonine-protein kinase [Gaiellaceae bacterium]
MADELIAGRYRLLEPLGRGAMSSVWLAEDEELGRRVAVKMLGPTADRQRFQREARAAAALSHPNIAAVYDYGEAAGRPYMVLEHLPNGSLEERLKRGPLDDEETTRIATEIAAGLAHAHERGLVHRDLKPANILFDGENRAKIADFGIARMGDDGTLTEAGTVLGTASYISPEQAAGVPAGPASDVYSFGVMLFRMLTGQLPFVSGNAMELVRMHRDDTPPPVAAFREDAPPRLEALAAAALAKDPAARPADGGALLRQLRSGDDSATTILGTPIASDATQILRRPPPPGRRRTLPLLLLAAALLVAGGALAFVATRSGGGTPAPSTGLSLPTVSTSKPTTQPATTAPTTTAKTTTTTPSTTSPSTTAPTTTHHVTTTAPTTTAPTPTPLPTVPVVPPTTTAATTTATTTDTTTAIPPPPTTILP